MTAHQGFYRQYRPHKFQEVIGQSVVTNILQEQIYRNKTQHAYLFAGMHGTGKTSTARIFARAVNCQENRSGELCNLCKICVANRQIHSDIIEIDAASNNGVEQIRILQEQAYLAPLQSRFKVYIIDEVHMLSKSAYNAFLKLLEEPPRHVIFILATTDIYKIPPTILSRCQIFRFNPLSQEYLIKILAKIAEAEQIPIENSVLSEIAKTAEGSVRDAINILEQGSLLLVDGKFTLTKLFQQLGRPHPDNILRFLDALLTNNMPAVFELSEQITKNNTNYSLMIGAIISQINELIFNHFASDDRKDKALTEIAANWPVAKLIIILKIFLKNATKYCPVISNKTALEILIWEILSHFQITPKSQLSSIPKTEKIVVDSSTNLNIFKKNIASTQSPTFSVSSSELINQALFVLQNRDKQIVLQMKQKWQNLENYIGEEDYDPFIKLFLSVRFISASQTEILLVIHHEEQKKIIDRWNKMPLFQQWLLTIFGKKFQVIALNNDQLEVVKMQFKKTSE